MGDGKVRRHKFKRPKTAKEAAGKVDYIEDFLGTEELSGTYEDRANLSHELEKEKLLIADYKRKKWEEYKKIAEKHERTQKEWDQINIKIDYLLPHVLEDNAYKYLLALRIREPDICRSVMTYLFPQSEIDKLDEYLLRIHKTGHGPRNKIKLALIVKIYRYFKGHRPTITVEREGERIPLGEAITGRKVA